MARRLSRSLGSSREQHVAAEDDSMLPPIPERYIRGCNGDMVEAKRRWRLTVQWRRGQRVDGILKESFPEFAVIKRHYPHFVYNRAKDGNVVYYERLGHIDISKMRQHGISMERLVRYYIFMTEYLWTYTDPRPDGRVVTVMDVEGVGIRDLHGEALHFMRTASDIMQMHYVERSCRILVINAPFMFSLVWKVVSPWINERTREKISIVGTDYRKELEKYVDADKIPTLFGGQDPTPPYESPEERGFKAFVDATVHAHAQAQAETEADNTTEHVTPPQASDRPPAPQQVRA